MGVVLWGLLLVAVLVREVARAIAAAAFYLNVKSVLLLPTGGLLTYAGVDSENQAGVPAVQRGMALVGPIANLLFGLTVAGFILTISPGVPLLAMPWVSPAHLLRTLVWVNLLLGALNFLPAWPLDGGRVMRSEVVRGTSAGPVRARILPGRFGVLVRMSRWIALSLVLYGILAPNLWIMMAGLGILLGAQVERQGLLPEREPDSTRVGDVMLTEYSILSASATLEDAMVAARHSLQDIFPVGTRRQYGWGGRPPEYSRSSCYQRQRVRAGHYDTQLPDRGVVNDSLMDTLNKAVGQTAGASLQIVPVVDGDAVVGILTPQHLQRVARIDPAASGAGWPNGGRRERLMVFVARGTSKGTGPRALGRVLALTGVLLIVVVVGFLIAGKLRARSWVQGLPGRLGVGISQDANGFSYDQSSKGRKIYTLHASKEVERTDGKISFHDVGIVTYGPTGQPSDRIHSADFTYDRKAQLLTAVGEVFIDLVPPAAKDAAGTAAPMTQEEVDRKMVHVKTIGLVFDQKGQLASSDGPVEFRTQEYSGKSVGATYDSKHNVIVLQSQVRLSGIRDARPVLLTAGHAEMDRNSNVIDLQRARYVSAGASGAETASASHAVIHTDAAGNPAKINAEGEVTLSSDQRGTVTSEKLDLDLGNRGQAQATHLYGNVKYTSDLGIKRENGRAEDARVSFDNGGDGRCGRG